MLIIIILFLLLYGISNYYVAYRIYNMLINIIPNMKLIIFIIIYTLLSISFFLSYLPFKEIKNIFNIISSIWLGFFVYLLILFLLVDIITFSLKWLNIIVFQHYVTTPIVMVMCFLIVGYGIYNSSLIKTVNYDIKIDNKKISDEFSILLISDLHLGSIMSEKRMEKIVHTINQMNSDIVCIVGDLFDNDFDMIKDPNKVKKLLSQIKSKYGVYASLGNHDSGKDFNKFIKLGEGSNIIFLKDTYITIDDKLVLVGRVDASPIGGFNGLKRMEVDDVFSTIDNNLPIVVMDHNPIYYKEYINKADLVLSGHTHRGQIFPANIITNMMYNNDYGLLKIKKTNVVVTSGAGTWKIPMRIGSNNEIVKIVISSK